MWPPALAFWPCSSTFKVDTRGPSHSLTRALALREKALGPEHPDVATSLNNLATLYDTRSQYATAEPLYGRRALAIRKKTLGSEYPAVAPASTISRCSTSTRVNT